MLMLYILKNMLSLVFYFIYQSKCLILPINRCLEICLFEFRCKKYVQYSITINKTWSTNSNLYLQYLRRQSIFFVIHNYRFKII